jgi:hypothetical protein
VGYLLITWQHTACPKELKKVRVQHNYEVRYNLRARLENSYWDFTLIRSIKASAAMFYKNYSGAQTDLH